MPDLIVDQELDTTEPDAEEVVEEVVVEAPKGFDWDALTARLGELPGEASDDLLGKLDDKAVADLPEHGKVLIKHLIAKQKADRADAAKAAADRQVELDKREAELDEDARKLNLQIAQHAALFENDEVKKVLAVAADTTKYDPLTAEGAEAILKREAAKNHIETNRPMLEAAKRARQQAAYIEVVAANPEMKRPEFKTKVRDLVKARAESGAPMPIQDAIEIIKGREEAAERAAKNERAQRERAAAMRRVSTGSSGGTTTARETPQTVASRISREGYEGLRGAQALAKFYQDNPKAYAAAKAAA